MSKPYAKLVAEQMGGIRPECDGCKGWAVTFIECHPVDLCAGAQQATVSKLLCKACLEACIADIQDTLLNSFLHIRPDHCWQCGLTIVSLSDIIVRIQPLWVLPEESDES
ncbi:hypothetical protein SEA_LITTLELAF_77 [Mycobacterium phage LittleLaf]|uniref:Uncharacterized protein n=7 Tax=Marvinvirus marvin TaxID=1982092 RepID=A0A3G8FHI0_9CAUD|nr:tail fiber protein [Mycobacterium phage Marvin]AYB69881.1 hypothetical protein SEA_LITTLELAF_77 [Mycobacterium phage LittleLaf]AYB70708.1 hypothetical protein SEA_VASUNZINGA_76 [Mycobacterium phage VasuNzinga]AZF93342.1 hypothetical protein SEA_BEELZEBUB_81 [Mycobacterium phage Beelzebub]QFP94215.1 hypothetical protein SEA_JOIEB_78 [Mycobacterium phage JoieB]QFP96937.1 hypothetical protein SEA_PRINGAR_75 [Mycobacterium phage Pringar]QFP97629.1 hypothetical protein SEA_CORAZON_74 [Mycobacte